MSIRAQRPSTQTIDRDLADDEARQHERNLATIALLDSWLDEDEQSEAEQRVELEWLMRALDEDRPSDRKLFP